MKTQILLASLASLSLGACASLSNISPSDTARKSADQVNSGIGSALQAPLEDLNLVRQEIPAVLTEAAADPYSVQNMGQCAAIGQEIARLDEALGPDLDAVPSEADAEDQLAEAASGVTLDAVRDTVTDFIPARSWVRRLSGAHRHSQLVQASIRAGLQRRAFLKGVGQQKNCAPPAAPAGYVRQ